MGVKGLQHSSAVRERERERKTPPFTMLCERKMNELRETTNIYYDHFHCNAKAQAVHIYTYRDF